MRWKIFRIPCRPFTVLVPPDLPELCTWAAGGEQPLNTTTNFRPDPVSLVKNWAMQNNRILSEINLAELIDLNKNQLDWSEFFPELTTDLQLFGFVRKFILKKKANFWLLCRRKHC